jgi:hypothetical protein
MERGGGRPMSAQRGRIRQRTPKAQGGWGNPFMSAQRLGSSKESQNPQRGRQMSQNPQKGYPSLLTINRVRSPQALSPFLGRLA